MATAVAQSFDLTAADDTAPVHVSSRVQALDLMMAGTSAVLDQGIDAHVYRAASGLIEGHRAGRKVNIEVYGYPFDVLENVAGGLEKIGASQYVTAQVMTALKEYILNMGSDFSRAAKAKPLYARIMVTDQAPDDLPECEQTQATFIDGIRKIGGEAARINVQSTVFGTKSTTSQGVDLNTMFASKTNGLFVFFGAPTNEGIGGFDSVDAALVNLAQGMAGGVGGGATAAAVEEIKQAIKNGEVTPDTLKLIEKLAVLAQVADASLTPGALKDAPAQMTAIVRDITQQIQAGVAEGTIPAAVMQGTVAVLTAMQNNEVLQAVMAAPEGAKTLIADNDNSAPVVEGTKVEVPAANNDNQVLAEQVQAIVAQLTEIAAAPTTSPDVRAQIELQVAEMTKAMESPKGAEMQTVIAAVTQTLSTMDTPAVAAVAAKVDVLAAQVVSAAPGVVAALPEVAALAANDVKELIATLEKADALPPALAQAVEKIDIKAMTPEKIAEALQGKGESAPAVQAIVVALANPAVQAQLPTDTLSTVTTILTRQPELTTLVPAQVTVQALESAGTGMNPDNPTLPEITKLATDLKTGETTLETLDNRQIETITRTLGDNSPVVKELSAAIDAAQPDGSKDRSVRADTGSVLDAPTKSLTDTVTARGTETPTMPEKGHVDVNPVPRRDEAPPRHEDKFTAPTDNRPTTPAGGSDITPPRAQPLPTNPNPPAPSPRGNDNPPPLPRDNAPPRPVPVKDPVKADVKTDVKKAPAEPVRTPFSKDTKPAQPAPKETPIGAAPKKATEGSAPMTPARPQNAGGAKVEGPDNQERHDTARKAPTESKPEGVGVHGRNDVRPAPKEEPRGERPAVGEAKPHNPPTEKPATVTVAEVKIVDPSVPKSVADPVKPVVLGAPRAANESIIPTNRPDNKITFHRGCPTCTGGCPGCGEAYNEAAKEKNIEDIKGLVAPRAKKDFSAPQPKNP